MRLSVGGAAPVIGFTGQLNNFISGIGEEPDILSLGSRTRPPQQSPNGAPTARHAAVCPAERRRAKRGRTSGLRMFQDGMRSESSYRPPSLQRPGPGLRVVRSSPCRNHSLCFVMVTDLEKLGVSEVVSRSPGFMAAGWHRPEHKPSAPSHVCPPSSAPSWCSAMPGLMPLAPLTMPATWCCEISRCAQLKPGMRFVELRRQSLFQLSRSLLFERLGQLPPVMMIEWVRVVPLTSRV